MAFLFRRLNDLFKIIENVTAEDVSIETLLVYVESRFVRYLQPLESFVKAKTLAEN